MQTPPVAALALSSAQDLITQSVKFWCHKNRFIHNHKSFEATNSRGLRRTAQKEIQVHACYKHYGCAYFEEGGSANGSPNAHHCMPHTVRELVWINTAA